MTRRPLIGISPYIGFRPKGRAVLFTYRSYARPLESAGADPLLLVPSPPRAARYARLLDGLLLTGGDDIHPKHFGRRAHDRPLSLSPDERTLFELRLARAFLSAGKPILGICLGCQTLNVALGGTLILDLARDLPATGEHRRGNHPIRIEPGSLLARVLGASGLRVNTRHHQALDKIGRGLRVAARSSDGIVEAVERPRLPFVLGVQWHPEEVPDRRDSRRLFRAFVKACRRSA